VRKHGPEGGVTDAADVGDLGAVFRVDDHAATLVKLEADVLEAEAVGIRATADRNEDDVSVKLDKCQ
jgi:hypothetical protein